MLLPEMHLLALPTRLLLLGNAAGRAGRGGAPETAPTALADGSHLLASAIPFQVSQDAVGGHRAGFKEAAECHLGAPRGDHSPKRSAIQRPSTGGYLLLLFAEGLAIGQSSTEPIQRLPECYLWRPLLGVPLTQTAWAAALVRIGTCYESPVTETRVLQGCLGDHATGTVQDTGPACSRHDREAAWCRRMILERAWNHRP